MKKKVIIASIVLIILYFLVKGFFMYYYNVDSMLTDDYQEIVDSFKIKDTLTINKKVVDNNDYLTVKNIKIKNDFKDFEKQKEDNTDYQRYILYDENHNVKAAFFMGKTYTNTYMLRNDPTFFGVDDKRLSNKVMSKILDENNIDNDLELFEFLRKNTNKKINFFTSIKEMKEVYTINLVSAIILPRIDSLTKIEGDYYGFIYNMKDAKEVDILSGNNRYTFTFFKRDYFTDDYINELLKTIIID